MLATSRELYRKLTGHKTDPGRASIDSTQDESSEDSDASSPSRKRPFLDYKTPDIHQKLNEIARGVSTTGAGKLHEKHETGIQVCGVQRSGVSPHHGCGHIAGCQRCIDSWLEHDTTCPHCSLVMVNNFPVRGLDEVLVCLRTNVEGE